MSDIDYETLYYSIIDNLDENLIESYDLDTIIQSAKLTWDDTAVEVNSTDFTMIFDILTFEILDYTGYDISGDDL